MEKNGRVERDYERETAHMNAVFSVKSQILDVASRSKDLLNRLEAAKKNGTNSKTYENLRSALRTASALGGNSSVNETETALKDLEKVAKDYSDDHKGIFSGYSESGKERREVARLAAEFASGEAKEFKNRTKAIHSKHSKVNDIINRRAINLRELQEMVGKKPRNPEPGNRDVQRASQSQNVNKQHEVVMGL